MADETVVALHGGAVVRRMLTASIALAGEAHGERSTPLRPSTHEVDDQGDGRDDQEKVNQAPREVKHEPAESPGDEQDDEGAERRR